MGNTQVFTGTVWQTVTPTGTILCNGNCQAYEYIECTRNGAGPGCGTTYTPCWNVGLGNKGCNNFVSGWGVLRVRGVRGALAHPPAHFAGPA